MGNSVCGLRGLMYIAGTSVGYTTSLSISLSRDVASVGLQGATYMEKCVGLIDAEFGGAAVVQNDQKQIFDEVTAGTSSTVLIYPDSSSTSNYWSFTGYFTEYSAEGAQDGFWDIDFSGTVDGAITVNGFA